MTEFDIEGGTGSGASRASAAQPWWARLAFLWGVWTLVGLFFASQLYVYFARTQKAVSFARSVAWQLAAVYVFALSTPLVLWLARRFRIERTNWRRSLAVHLLAGTAIAVVWAGCHIAIDSYFSGEPSLLVPFNLARNVFVMLDKELLVYLIIVLISHAAVYYQRYREGELRASQAQLQALKMQLHPHFLFNSLHAVSALVHSNPDAADKMIARLGDFLRLTLDASATQEVPLRRELEFLNCYLEIERTRFNDRLTTGLEVDPRALDCRVPNLILQPLVENAIRHGVAPRSAPGHVEVRAERRGEVLRLEVSDNGAGLAGARCSKSLNTKGGVGLSNTRARLEQLYGSAFRFELADGPRGGAVATIEIPFRHFDAEPAARPDTDAPELAPRPTRQTSRASRPLSTRA
ncbi:MAG TPA: histidine kinase [Pyrinomonadaceae bacterium]|nr:histidine kinase [Pyrinomonadaceae bacterium]